MGGSFGLSCHRHGRLRRILPPAPFVQDRGALQDASGPPFSAMKPISPSLKRTSMGPKANCLKAYITPIKALQLIVFGSLTDPFADRISVAD